MSVLVVGSVALDSVATPLGRCREVLGGSATYCGFSARFFSPVSLVAVVGEDFPKKHLSFLKKKKIDMRGLEVKKGKTFRWEGEYGWDFTDPHTLSTCLNVFAEFNPSLPPEYKKSRYVFLANIDPHIQEDVLRQVRRPKLVAADTMNYWIEKKRPQLLRLLKKVDIFLVNESEARQLTGQSHLLQAAHDLIHYGPKRVIIKQGAYGVLLCSENSCFSLPAFLLSSVIDPTGAGDTFAGAMMGYLASCGTVKESALRKAVAYGSILATFSVEDFSLRKLATITKKDIEKRLSIFKRRVSF